MWLKNRLSAISSTSQWHSAFWADPWQQMWTDHRSHCGRESGENPHMQWEKLNTPLKGPDSAGLVSWFIFRCAFWAITSENPQNAATLFYKTLLSWRNKVESLSKLHRTYSAQTNLTFLTCIYQELLFYMIISPLFRSPRDKKTSINLNRMMFAL